MPQPTIRTTAWQLIKIMEITQIQGGQDTVYFLLANGASIVGMEELLATAYTVRTETLMLYAGREERPLTEEENRLLYNAVRQYLYGGRLSVRFV